MVKRRKIKKSKDSPAEKRIKEKDGEVAIARGRLAGALKVSLNRNSDETDESDTSSFSSSNSAVKKIVNDSSPSPWKKMNDKGGESEDHQSYLMKLFDRSVDLAQFDAKTPLYPVCRAWIQNKPFTAISRHKEEKSGLVEIKHENETDDHLFELNKRPATVVRADEMDVLQLPKPKPLPEGVHTLRIPSPVPHEIQDIDLNADPELAPSRDELLQSHLKNWSNVRRRWRAASLRNEERYAASKEILTKMFERAQIQFRMSS